MDEPTRIFQERPLQLLPSELFIARLFDPRSGCGGGGGGGGRRRKRSKTFEHNGNIIPSHVNETFLSRMHSVTTNLQPLQSQNEVLLLKQKMSDLRAIKYANPANPNILEWAIAPITIVFERFAMRSVNPYVDIKRMTELLNNGMDYKVKYFDETSSYPIIVQTTGFSYDGKYLDSIMLDSRTLMSVTPFYVAFKRPISTERKVYVRVHHRDGRMCYPQCLIPGSNPPVYQSCSGAIRITNELPTM